MGLGDMQRLVHAFLDCNRGHDDHELGESESPVQFEGGPEIDVGLSRSSFHLYGEVAGLQVLRRWQPVANLDAAQVLENPVIVQGQPVASSRHGLLQAGPARQVGVASVTRHRRDREFGPVDLLAPENAAHRVDCGMLVLQVGLEVQLHFRIPIHAMILPPTSASFMPSMRTSPESRLISRLSGPSAPTSWSRINGRFVE